MLGSVELIGSDGSVTAIALVQEFVPNQGDGWTLTLRHLDRVLNEMAEDEAFDADGAHEPYWSQAEVLARCIGEMHRAFAIDVADPAFAPEATTEADIEAWTEHTAGLAAKARQILGRAVVSGSLSGEAMSAGTRVLDDWEAIERRCAVRAVALAGTVRTRIHGDLHLGQVVVVGGDFYILDFEGEPLHTLEWRRSKYSPLRDVAGMIRSFDYAGSAALMRRRVPAQAGDRAASEREIIARWRTQTTARFIAAYRQSIAGCPSLPEDFEATLDAFVLEKALYEVCYDAANRPGWLGIPLAGVGRLLDSASRRI